MKRAYLTSIYFISSCVRYLCNSIIMLSSLTFNFVLSFIMKLVRFKLRESIAPPIWSEYNLQTVKQCHPLEKKKLTKLKLVLIFSWFIDHNKLYPNYEDFNYKRSLFTTPSSTKISTNPTQNEITLKGSEIECAKKQQLKSYFTQSFKSHPVFFFKQSSVVPLRGI